jgi:hypothetical protein
VSAADVQNLVIGALQGVVSSTLFVLIMFIGFCVLIGFTKLKKTAGGKARVVKSLDEVVSLKPMIYLTPNAPRGPADQLRAPELLEKA